MDPIQIDKDVAFSESQLWQLQRCYYEKQGLQAWKEDIPFYATSNPFIADRYAELFARSFLLNPNATETAFILELGGGSGQFAYYFLTAFQRWSKRFKIENPQICYMLSDCVEQTVAAWMRNTLLSPFTDLGWLDFSCFDATRDNAIFLKHAQKPLAIQKNAPPVWIVASYLMDSLPADLYAYENGVCTEMLISSETPKANMTEDGLKSFSDLTVTYQNSAQKAQSQDPISQAILDEYAQLFSDTSLLFPRVGLELMSRINTLFPQGTFWLVADKAYTDVSQLDFLDEPEITGHSGAFSVIVDYHAIARYCELNKGRALLEPPSAGIKLGLFRFGEGVELTEKLDGELETLLHGFTPAHYIHLHRQFLLSLPHVSLEAIVSQLTLSRWDPVLFKHAYSRIQTLFDGADVLTVNSLLSHADRIAENFYNGAGCYDIFFELAVLFHMLKRYAEAQKFYTLSTTWFEPNYGVLFNLGVCAYHQNDHEAAREYFLKAETLNPNTPAVAEFLAKV